jgi:hypothetical protein
MEAPGDRTGWVEGMDSCCYWDMFLEGGHRTREMQRGGSGDEDGLWENEWHSAGTAQGWDRADVGCRKCRCAPRWAMNLREEVRSMKRGSSLEVQEHGMQRRNDEVTAHTRIKIKTIS